MIYMKNQIKTNNDGIPHKRCELCEYYKMFDSGYGYCQRYPPKIKLIKLIPLKYKIMYAMVAWCDLTCGEFKKVK